MPIEIKLVMTEDKGWYHIYILYSGKVPSLEGFNPIGESCVHSLGDLVSELIDQKPTQVRFVRRDGPSGSVYSAYIK